MKTSITLVALLLVGLLGSGCATVSRLNAEYEEEVTRIEKMSPEEKEAWEKDKEQQERIELFEWSRQGDND